MKSPYCSIWIANSSILGAKNNFVKQAYEFLLADSLRGERASKDLDQILFFKLNKYQEDPNPLLCLRCSVSHSIFYTINDICKKYKNLGYEFIKSDLFSEFLEDGGQNYNYVVDKKTGNFIRGTRIPLNLFFFQKKEKEIPFGVEIIKSFDTTNGTMLSTWTTKKILWSSKLKKYFLSFGIRNISPFALLADTSKKKVKKACENFGYRGETLSQLINIHTSYLELYKPAKKRFRKLNNSNYGWMPNYTFLQSLDPPQKNDINLLKIDEAIRFYDIPSIENYPENYENQYSNDLQDLEEVNHKDLIKKSINSIGLKIVKNKINIEKSKSNNDPIINEIWLSYARGMNQKQIQKKEITQLIVYKKGMQ